VRVISVWMHHKNDIMQLSLRNAFMCVQRSEKDVASRDPWVMAHTGNWVKSTMGHGSI